MRINSKPLYSIIKLPVWIAPALTILFAILWGTWLLPHTVAVRHTSMVLGAILGLYVCQKSFHLFFRKEAFSIACIFALIIWVTLHLIFIGQDSVVQLDEYSRAWKKVWFCIPFALGMGIAIAYSRLPNQCWKIFYFGLFLPTFIYFIKWIFTRYAIDWGIENPHFLLNSDHTGSYFGVSRALYSFFCMPGFAVAVFSLLNHQGSFTKFDIFYFLALILTPLLFFLENERTGLLVVSFVMLLSVLTFLSSIKKNLNGRTLATGLLFLIGLAVASAGFMKRFDRWQSIVANTKVAIAIDANDYWKYQGKKGYPKNEFGEMVETSNYERIAWARAGTRLLLENPLGYGLLTLSFDKLSKQQWPGSHLSMTHSGWIDFALGYGIPGVLLLFCASLALWRNGFRMQPPWKVMIILGFGSLNIVFFMKELSVETTVNAFIFMILFLSALFVGISTQPKDNGTLV
jgi:hypothetical protein